MEILPEDIEEEAELVGRLISRGWIPPEEAKKYVKLADDQSLPPIRHQPEISPPCEKACHIVEQQNMLKAGWRKVEVKDGS